MSEILNKEVYQKNRRYMAWCALLVMAVVTIVVLIWPERMSAADSIIMMMYGALSALVGAYFGFAKAIKQPK